jgi:hypothetical protein
MINFLYGVACYYVVSFLNGVVIYCMCICLSDVVFYYANNFLLGVLSPLPSWTHSSCIRFRSVK